MSPLEKRSVITLLLLHLVGWTLLPWLTNTCLPLDSVEAVYWGYEWRWGYDKHPPLSAWAAEAFVLIFGDFGNYLLSQLCIIAAAVGLWKVGGEFALTRTQKVASLLLLETVLYYNYTSPEFNVNLIQLPFWSFGWLYGLRAAKSGAMLQWLGLGVCVGLAALGKYLGIFLLIPLFACYWQRGEFAKVLKSPGIYVAGVVSMLVFLPHFLWMMRNDFVTVTYGLERTSEGDPDGFLTRHLLYPLEYGAGQLGTLLPLLLIAVWAGRRRSRPAAKGLGGLAWGALGFVVLLSLVMGWQPVTMWSVPFCLGIGLWAASRLPTDFSLQRLYKGGVGFGLLALLAYGLVYGGGPFLRDKPHRVNYPSTELAAAAEAIWATQTDAPLEVVAGERFPAAIVSRYGDSRPSVMVLGDEKLSGLLTNKKVRETGALVLWRKSRDSQKPREKQRQIGKILPVFLEAFPEVEMLDDLVVAYPRRNDGKRLRLGVAIVRPQ